MSKKNILEIIDNQLTQKCSNYIEKTAENKIIPYVNEFKNTLIISKAIKKGVAKYLNLFLETKNLHSNNILSEKCKKWLLEILNTCNLSFLVKIGLQENNLPVNILSPEEIDKIQKRIKNNIYENFNSRNNVKSNILNHIFKGITKRYRVSNQLNDNFFEGGME